MNDNDLFDLKTTLFFNDISTIADEEIKEIEYPWQIIPKIKDIIYSLIPTLPPSFKEIKKDVWVEDGCEISQSAEIIAPCIICKSQIRPGAYLRGCVIIGRGCVVGNSTEIKNSILFDGAKCPHYNYVGDSVLGKGAHMGAGAIISNQKSDKTRVFIALPKSKIDTGLEKMGAILSDGVEIGASSVLNPGSVICAGSSVYPLTSFRGAVGKGLIYKNKDNIVEKY